MRSIRVGIAFNFWGQTVLAVIGMVGAQAGGFEPYAWLTLASFTFAFAVYNTRAAILGEDAK